MDRFIAGYPAVEDGDLMLCDEHGVAYQKDQTNLVAYDAAYYDKCLGYEGQEIANKINDGRVDFVAKHYGNGVVDVGIGSGEFIKRRGGRTYGHDINPAGIEWLKRNDRWVDRLSAFGAVTFWDVLEHVPTPEDYFRQIQQQAWVFCSLPIVYGLSAIRLSKHYRPGEHLYYFTQTGFVYWMERHGFLFVEMDDFEIRAGRESIYSFAFKRYRWPK
jgi:hypothetical protein